MARPREFDEEVVLDAALQCFWARGYEATSVRDLIGKTGITGASLYNAFGDKRSLYHAALDRYVEEMSDRIRRCEALAPRKAIGAFFAEIVKRSLEDRQQKGCMLVNAALEVALYNKDLKKIVADALIRVEEFFLRCVRAGQAEGAINQSLTAENLAHHLLGALIGVRVLAKVRPEPALLKGIVAASLALLDRCEEG